jgi:uncharacterized membrane protein
MTHDFSDQVGKIVESYLDRLRNHLRGLPEPDREELAREIYSHIYESYSADSTGDDIQRISGVLDRLGKPSQVVATRLSGTMKRMGKKRNRPFLILAGIILGIFGLPLGAGALALLIGLGAVLAALILVYYMTAGILVFGGWITIVITTVRLFSPGFLSQYVHNLGQFLPPPLGMILNLVVGTVFVAMGMGMFWLGRNIPSGARFLFGQAGEAFRNLRRRKIPVRAAVDTDAESGSPDTIMSQTG